MKKDFDKKAIGALVHRKITECNSGNNSSLSSERLKLLDYYNGKLPAKVKGRSSYVSRDVFDGVEGLKAQLVETFSGGTDIVRFTPEGPEDVRPARISTAFAGYWFWRRNGGEQVIRSLAHDGLLARVGIVKVYWLPETTEVEEKFGPMDPLELEAMNSDPDVLESVSEIDPATGMVIGGKLTRERKSGRVVVENVAPEEFGIDPSARDLSSFHYHRTPLSAAEIERRWPKSQKLLKNVAPDASPLFGDTESNARLADIDDGYRADRFDGVLPEDKKYWVYECYFTTQHPTGDHDCLLQVTMVGNQVLALQEVDRTPFKSFVPLPISHSFYGNNFARLLVASQISRTALIRAVLDHAALTTNPRYLVEAGGLVNARELLDNRLGGIVNITRPDSVMPLPQSPLNPFIFQTQDMIRVAAEQSTGVSALSVGMDKAVISNQNSAALIAQQVDLAQIRQRLPARALADCLREIFIEINQLAVEHCDRAEWIDVAGEWVEVDQQRVKERKTAEVTMHLSPGDREQAAMKKIQFFTQARQDPMINEMITVDNAYQFAMDAAEGAEIRDVANYITHPSKLPPKKPDQNLLRKLDLEERTVALQEGAVQAQMEKVKAQHEIAMLKLELENVRLRHDLEMRTAEMERKAFETASRVDIAQREQAVVESAPVDPTKPIASPGL